MMRVVLPILMTLLFALGSCKKPRLEPSAESVPPIILATSINDSLPSGTVKALGLEKVNGLKILYRSGEQISYFQYRTDRKKLLRVLSELPFNADSRIADTLCRQISIKDLGRPWDDLSNLDSRMPAYIDDADVVVYQCSKPPYLHTIIAHKASDEISHRVELVL